MIVGKRLTVDKYLCCLAKLAKFQEEENSDMKLYLKLLETSSLRMYPLQKLHRHDLEK